MAIEDLREKIDRIDERVIKLLGERAQLAMKIGQMKGRSSTPVFAPDREEKVLRHVEAVAKDGALSAESVRAIYAEVISACRAAERKLVVAFLGPRGTFSHHAARAVRWGTIGSQAARKRFGSGVELAPVSSIEAVFTEVAQGRADYGVVPIENTTEGGIGATLDMFMETDLRVAAEILVRVHHAMLSKCAPRAVRQIYSKAEIFGQCRNWLANHYPQARLVEAASSAQAAELAAKSTDSAAIANEEAAAIFGLNVLHQAIEDNPFNMTRFYVVGSLTPTATGNDKTSILCFIKDEAGALQNILMPFWRAGVNLTKIESWPSKRKAWDYCFFIDFEGHCDDPRIARALERVRGKCSDMKVLGSFPAAR